MAELHPKKDYEFTKGEDWVYDRVLFDNLPLSIDVIKIPMSESEYKAFEAIRRLCHIRLGDDYSGPMPIIELREIE